MPRVERALSARPQAALAAGLPAATAAKDVLVVRQTGGKWRRAGRWTVPDRIKVRTKLCRVTSDFTDAVITSRTARIDTDMQHGKLVAGAPGIVTDAGGLSLVFSQTRLRPDSAAADPGAPHRARRNARAREGHQAAAVSPPWPENPVLARSHLPDAAHDFRHRSTRTRAPRHGSLSCCRTAICSRRLQRAQPGHLRWACQAGRTDCEARRFGDIRVIIANFSIQYAEMITYRSLDLRACARPRIRQWSRSRWSGAAAAAGDLGVQPQQLPIWLGIIAPAAAGPVNLCQLGIPHRLPGGGKAARLGHFAPRCPPP
jgi:hypothetical protein